MLWKVSWNFLPTLANVQYRQICTNPSCPRCGREIETTSHVFRGCPVSREVWQHLNLSWVLTKSELEMWQWLTWVFSVADNSQCVMICCALWVIWNARNKMIHENQQEVGLVLANRIFAFIKENENISIRGFTRCSTQEVWRAPEAGTIRINFDAAFNTQLLRSAGGLVVRNSSGDILASKAVIQEFIASPFAAEASACVEAVRLGKSVGLAKVEIEGDCLTVIKKS